MTAYSIGYSWARALRRMPADEAELDAVERLADERGTEGDVRAVAALLVRQGHGDAARELLRILPPTTPAPPRP